MLLSKIGNNQERFQQHFRAKVINAHVTKAALEREDSEGIQTVRNNHVEFKLT